MEPINIFEAKNRLSGLIKDIEKKGMSYLICRNGKPVAELVAHKPKDRLETEPELRVESEGPLYGDDMSEDWECLE